MNILLTGATSGIGWETFKDLWKSGHHLILPVRNREKAIQMLQKLGAKDQFKLYPMDLNDLHSVQKAGEAIASDYPQIDVLINNAGGMFKPREKTKDGIDVTFSTNHLGHFLLNKLLIPNLTGPRKIISVSSVAHQFANPDPNDLGLAKASNTFSSYANAKLYNILYTKGLKENYQDQNVQAYSLHPGAVKTAFGSDSGPLSRAIIRASQVFFISAEKGAQTTLHLTKTEPGKLINGAYYDKKKVKSTSSKAMDRELIQNLWEYSESEISRILG
ncbi:SDR family NAD(P)-dependent oxidoreductase [Algoriphagus namhaensis]